MISSPTDSLLASLDLDIGTFRFYPNLVISEIREGAIVDFDKMLPVFVRGQEFYTSDTPFVYISDRKNSYSFDPTLHLETRKMFENLGGYGVVVYDEVNRRIAILEQNFMKCPVKIFSSLDDAKKWARNLV